jgi:hypothetical protein
MADMYDCCDNEDLRHEHPDDAVEEYLDACEATNWPRVLQVKAWDHSIVVELDKDRFAEWAIDNLLENLHDNYGGDDYVNIAPEQQLLVEAAARNFVDVTVAAYGQPWRCDRVPREDEWVPVAAWVLENKPEWIEADPLVRAFVEDE